MAVRCTLPENEWLPGRNNQMAIVSTKYLYDPSSTTYRHQEKYVRVRKYEFLILSKF